MPGVLTNRTRVTTSVRLGEAQLDAGADHERRSAVEPSPFWSSASCDISVLPLKAEIKQWVSSSPSLNCSLELEITFCVRGVSKLPFVLFAPKLFVLACIHEFGAYRNIFAVLDEPARDQRLY